jgi:hypothetical protein
MSSRALPPVVGLLVASLLGGANAGAADARTYVPNCGNTSYLAFRPDNWSAGCMAGSFNMPTVRWSF